MIFPLYLASWLVFKIQCRFSFSFFLIGAFRAASGYKFRLYQVFRSISDFYTLRNVRRKTFLSMSKNVSAVSILNIQFLTFPILFFHLQMQQLYGWHWIPRMQHRLPLHMLSALDLSSGLSPKNRGWTNGRGLILSKIKVVPCKHDNVCKNKVG